MAEKNPFDNILGQISEMLNLIQKNQDKKLSGEGVSPEAEKDLAHLEAILQMYNEVANETLKFQGESPEILAKKIEDKSSEFSREQQKFLKKAENLKKEIFDLQTIYTIPQQPVDTQKKKVAKKSAQKKHGDARKKKFKRLSGGDKGWMPL
jgi:hypothetical protein